MTSAPLILVEALTHRYADRVVLELPAWRVEAGCHTLVLGPSGSGKSTLLTLLAGLLTPTSGRVQVEDFNVSAANQRDRDAWRARKVGFVMQRLYLIGALTVEQNLALAQTLAGVSPDATRIRDTLARLSVGDKAGRRPHELSVGEAQRVAIARAVLHKPALLLADEPTSALDDASCTAALDLLETAAAESGATLVVATHDQRIKDRFAQPLLLGGAGA